MRCIIVLCLDSDTGYVLTEQYINRNWLFAILLFPGSIRHYFYRGVKDFSSNLGSYTI